jgi:sRNA-binding regulator protein Hfq
MSDQKKIIGESITVYMDGGWTLSGVVKTSESNKLVISDNGELYLVFKSKVCAMKLSGEKVNRKQTTI